MCKRVQKQAKSKHVLPNARHTAMGGRVAQLTEVSHGQLFKGPVATHNRCWLANCGLAKGPVRSCEAVKSARCCETAVQRPGRLPSLRKGTVGLPDLPRPCSRTTCAEPSLHGNTDRICLNLQALHCSGAACTVRCHPTARNAAGGTSACSDDMYTPVSTPKAAGHFLNPD